MRQRIGFCTTTDDVRIAYATAGQGRPLLRVGGWLTHIEHDWDSPVWRHWLRELTRDHTLARFDIRGTGLSDRAVDGQALEAWVRDVEAVADSLGWRRFPVWGSARERPSPSPTRCDTPNASVTSCSTTPMPTAHSQRACRAIVSTRRRLWSA